MQIKLKNDLAYHKIEDNNSVLEGGSLDEIDMDEVAEEATEEVEEVATGKRGKKK